MVKLQEGKSYLIKHKISDRSSAKIYEMKVQILEIQKPQYGRQLIITNHRPWGEGGTGQLYLDQIVEATEIPRGPVPR
jgi:hypothetical protein